jgi:hypothetical protein
MTSLYHLQGTYVENTEGIATIRLSITDESLITTSDTPANTKFMPRIRNAEQFSIKRRPSFWPWYDSQRQGAGVASTIDFEDFAAFGSIDVEDYDGQLDFLKNADLRDATVILQIAPAKMLAAANTVSTAPIVATCVLDDVQCQEDDVKTIILKDTLARLDRQLLVRYNPPYVISNAANRMVPITLGACRNVPAQLIDEENRLYRLHDAMLGNIASVRDGGERLSDTSDPPQVTPALDRSGFQLQVLTEHKCLVDCSSVGQQVIGPGVTDVLAGVGTLDVTDGLTTWPVAGSAPTGWTYGNPTAGTYTRLTGSNLGITQDYAMQMVTHHVYNPTGSEFGLNANVTTPFLQPGQHYRVRFILDRLYRPQTDGTGGFLVRTDLTRAASGDVSGPAVGPYLTAASGGQNYVFDYACPNDGTVRTLYMIMVGSGASFPDYTGTWHGLTVELLGQFTELPLDGIKFQDYFYEVLFNRAFEDTAIWNASDLIALDNATGYRFGIHFEDPPNILRDMLMPPIKSAGGTLFTDATGVIRTRRLTDPKLGTPVAAFDLTNSDRPMTFETDRAEYLTTVMGVRRNWAISNDPADFVTSTDDVPADIRARYSRQNQYEVTSTVTPAGQYVHAIGAPIFDSYLDGPDDDPALWGRTEIDRVVGLYKQTVYSDGTVFNGKRRFVEFPAHFDDIAAIGVGTTVAPQNILIGDVVTLTYAEHGFNNTPILVAGTELFPFGQMLIIRGWY